MNDSVETVDEIRGKAVVEEREKVLRALRSCYGNVSMAAKQIGVSRHSMNRKIRKHGLR